MQGLAANTLLIISYYFCIILRMMLIRLMNSRKCISKNIHMLFAHEDYSENILEKGIFGCKSIVLGPSCQ